MKKTIQLILISIVMQSCNSQKKDLAKITFTEKYETFFGDIPNEYKKNESMIDFNLYNVYSTKSEEALYFNGIDLSGYRDEKGKFGTNNITFEFSKNDNTLNYYSVMLFKKEKIGKLIEALDNKIGKPVYVKIFFSNSKKSNPDALLWEDNTSFYFITGANQNISFFTVFNKKNDLIRKRKFSPGDFNYYGNYLKYLDEKNKTTKQISYYQYAKLMENDGDDNYIKSYVKP